MLSLKCDQPFVSSPFYFPNSSKDSKVGHCNLGLRLYFQVFRNPERDQKLEFLNVDGWMDGFSNF